MCACVCECTCECVHAPAGTETALTAWVHVEQSISDDFAGNHVKTYGPVSEGEYAGKNVARWPKPWLLP